MKAKSFKKFFVSIALSAVLTLSTAATAFAATAQLMPAEQTAELSQEDTDIPSVDTSEAQAAGASYLTSSSGIRQIRYCIARLSIKQVIKKVSHTNTCLSQILVITPAKTKIRLIIDHILVKVIPCFSGFFFVCSSRPVCLIIRIILIGIIIKLLFRMSFTRYYFSLSHSYPPFFLIPLNNLQKIADTFCHLLS